eukprot:7414476-Pyramimonas_sp.AAC.1
MKRSTNLSKNERGGVPSVFRPGLSARSSDAWRADKGKGSAVPNGPQLLVTFRPGLSARDPATPVWPVGTDLRFAHSPHQPHHTRRPGEF